MADALFEDPYLASLYDRLAVDRGGHEFYLHLMHSVPSALDMGCGTGALLHRARREGHSGRLVGIDPAEAMLARARARTAEVEWIRGTALDAAGRAGEFALVCLTGHAFQVLLTDEELFATLAAIRAALADGGRFAFEVGNPHVHPWEQWTPARVTEIADDDGHAVRTWREVVEVHREYVRFTENFASSAWDAPRVSTSTLRFLPAGHLDAMLIDAGFVVDERYGDWDRRPFTADSPEVITVASVVSSASAGRSA